MPDRAATDTERDEAELMIAEQREFENIVAMRDALREAAQEGHTYPGIYDDLALLGEAIDLKGEIDAETDAARRHDLETAFIEHLAAIQNIAPTVRPPSESH